MLVLLLSFLATKFVAGDSHFDQQQPIRVTPQYVPESPPEIKPIDLTDDIYNSDSRVNPNFRIHYNFEQLRRDQRPQVENRNEAIGSYLYNRPRKTTTKPKPVRTYAPQLQKNNDDEVNNWNLHQLSAPVLPSRPTEAAPHWQDVLSDKQPAYPQYPARFPIWTENQNMPPQSQFVPTQPQYEPTQAPDMTTHRRKTMRFSQATPASQFVPTFTSRTALELSTTPSWMNDAPILQRNEPSHPAKGRSHSSRGSHKFNWSEADPTEFTSVISGNHREGPSAANPPPPVPTLSAWHGDNLGK